MVYGPETYSLCLWIPWQNIETYLHWYRAIKKIEEKITYQTFEPHTRRQALKEDIKALPVQLKMGKITKSEFTERVVKSFIEFIPFAFDRANVLYNINQHRGHSKGRRKNVALDFLIYAISYDLKALNVPLRRYSRICGFLREQNILDNPSISNIQRRQHRVMPYRLLRRLFFYQIILHGEEEWMPEDLKEVYAGPTFFGLFHKSLDQLQQECLVALEERFSFPSKEK
ncbi:MAG: hypothetical protein A4E62_02791 [Syntrophorhabdus sp. PtaU1.Bin002]|nr:MAG: hypothetical protein A4E62_02791 [Syntrophorhabdus sp. PtaU1.Bin002]